MALHGKIIFRTYGGDKIGMNHLIRCAALTEMLRGHYECVLAIRVPNPSALQLVGGVFHSIISLPASENYDGDELISYLQAGDIVVLDGIQFQTDYQKKIREHCKIVCIDDLHNNHFVADAIINHAEGILPKDYSTDEHTRFYLGARYAMIRQPFIKAAIENSELSIANRAMIHIGGNDFHNTTQKVLSALVNTEMINEIEIVVSKMNPNISLLEDFIYAKRKTAKIMLCKNLPGDELCDLMKSCRYMICAANNVLYEACAVGMKIISGYTSPTQLEILHGLVAKGVVNNFGNFLTEDENNLKARFELFMNDETTTEQLSNQKQLIDGKSPDRLFEIFNKL